MTRIARLKTRIGKNHLRGAEVAGLRDANGFAIERFVAAAVGDHQFAIGFAAGVNHLLTFGRRVRHRLFAEHMLAGLKSAHRVLGVHAVGQHDVNHIHIGIVFDRIVILIVVNVLFIDFISQRELVGFVRMSADESDDFGLLAFGERGENLIDRQTAQADDGPSELLARRIGNMKLGGCGFQQAFEGAGCEQALSGLLHEIAAGEFVDNRHAEPPGHSGSWIFPLLAKSARSGHP